MTEDKFEDILAGNNGERGGLFHWKLLDSYDMIEKMLDVVFEWRNQAIADLAGPAVLHTEDEDARFDLVFRGAACSSVAVGAITPLLDTLLVSAEWKWEQHQRQSKKKGAKKPKGRGEGKFVNRLDRLLASVAAEPSCVPDETRRRVGALYAYRDTALHNGYEWTASKSAGFQKMISKTGSAKWFDVTTVDGAPWLFTMKDSFIKATLADARTLASILRDVDQKFT